MSMSKSMGKQSDSFGKVWLNLFFQHRGLEILSTSYTSPRTEPPLDSVIGKLFKNERGEPVRVVRNIRVKISNQFYDAEKNRFSHQRKLGGSYARIV